MNHYFKFFLSFILLLTIGSYTNNIDAAASSPDEIANKTFAEFDGDCWEWGTFEVVLGIATCDNDEDNCTKPCDDDER